MRRDSRDVGVPAIRTFDGFELLRSIGEGGMGAVHLARDSALDRLVAIKFISSNINDPNAQQRLLREARVIARLQHPNIVAIYRTGEVEGRPYIAYEYVEGRPISALPRPLSWLGVLRIGLGLSRGLAAAHRAGILHRDIKPANAMLATGGEVKLLDFGLARFTEREAVEQRQLDDWIESTALDVQASARDLAREPLTSLGGLETVPPQDSVTQEWSLDQLTGQGLVVGTPLFLAPELWRGAPATRRSDLYALGLVLYDLLAGGLPHAHLGTLQIARFVTNQTFPLLAERFKELPRAFVELIDQLVSRDPRQRPDSADRVRDAMEALASIYLPFGESSTDEVNAEGARVSASFLRVSAHGHNLAVIFYERLFSLDPTLRELFVADLTTQHRMLTAALKLVVDNLQRPERMVPYLLELGRRHAGYGVRPSHLAAMGQALLDTLSRLDGEWSEEAAHAWSQAYWHIAQVVQRGIESADSGTHRSGSLARARWEIPLVTPQTQWVAVEGGDVAYQCIGRGSLEILVLGEWVTHLENMWLHPTVARFFRQLASFARVVILDRRGCGLSSRTGPISLDHALADIRAVMDAAGMDRPVLLGIGDGATAATLFAALRPERTRALVLFGSGRCRLAGLVQSEDVDGEILRQQLRAVRAQWGTPMFIDALAPSLVSDTSYRMWWSSSLRQSASPGEAAALWRLGAMTGARSIAHGLRVPTLLLHRADDRFRPAADSRELAVRIPGARYVELPGADHVPWAGDAEAVLSEIHRFLDSLVTPPASGRIVGCILAVRAEPGAPAALWELVATLISRHQGVTMPVEAPGTDRAASLLLGFFDGPRRALSCAVEIAEASRRADYGARSAIDIGLLSADTAADGEAVKRAVALAQHAAPEEVLASDAIRELAEGADYSFVERPVHTADTGREPAFSVTRLGDRPI